MNLALVAGGLLAACGGVGSGSTPPGTQGMQAFSQRTVVGPTKPGTVWPNAARCAQEHRHATLSPAGEKMRFPKDCGVTGYFSVPGITNPGPPSYTQVMYLCVSPDPIYISGQCSGGRSDKNCLEASSTFWYATAAQEYGYRDEPTDYTSNKFPIKFNSSTLVVPGNQSGLCVVDGGTQDVIQDDFASGHTVTPQGDTIHLEVVLPASYNSELPGGDALNLFFESTPSSS